MEILHGTIKWAEASLGMNDSGLKDHVPHTSASFHGVAKTLFLLEGITWPL